MITTVMYYDTKCNFSQTTESNIWNMNREEAQVYHRPPTRKYINFSQVYVFNVSKFKTSFVPVKYNTFYKVLITCKFYKNNFLL